MGTGTATRVISTPVVSKMDVLKFLSRQDILDLIGKGRAVVIYEDLALDLTNWIEKHPGGDTAVMHMVGREATDEMNAYHSEEVIRTFRKWKIGHVETPWKNMLPPIQGGNYTSKKVSILPPEELRVKSIDTVGKSSGFGFPGGKVRPVVDPLVVVSRDMKTTVFPVVDALAIVDPQMLASNYDNKLSQEVVDSIPSLDYETQDGLREKYVALHEVIIAHGFYRCDYWNYGRELVKIGSLFLYAALFFKLHHLTLSAFFIGMAWQQMTFIAHDAGHVSLTHNYEVDNVFGMLIADWFGGLSLGWWKRNHNVHHLVTNDPVHDPDIQHLPFFAVSSRLFGDVYSTYYSKYLWFDALAKKTIPLQNYLYYPILCFGRFNLYRLSWEHLLLGLGPRKGKAAWFRYFEIVGLSFFFYWFFYLVVYKSIDNGWDRFSFVMVSHITTMIVHVQITLSHFAMSTADLGLSESFVLRQIRTTMDVDCPEWLDFLHGGLQFQAIHHLFPRLPRHNFRKVQPFVIDFCKDVGLKYSIYGFGRGNEIVISKLAEIAKQCTIMLEATKKLPELDH